MSWSFIDRNIRTIYDENGKKKLKIPGHTILDNIVFHLWCEIAKYMDYHQYALCIQEKNRKIPLGYREITLNEFDNQKEKFIKYYWRNNGVYTFDEINQFYCFLKINNQNKNFYRVIDSFYLIQIVDVFCF